MTGEACRGLRLQKIRIALQGRDLLHLDAHISTGETLTVMGPSGGGKSTLLAYVIGTVAIAFTTSGQVYVNGRDVTHLPPEARRIGILYQDDLLFPHLTVGANLAFGLTPSISGREARQARIETALEEIDMAGFAQRDPATLSGGQKARIALMRVLLSEPEALLLDEPFSRLDMTLRHHIRNLVFSRARAHGLPVLMVTHDIADAEAAGEQVIRLGEAG